MTRLTKSQIVQNYIDEKYGTPSFKNAIKPRIMSSSKDIVTLNYTVTADMLSPARLLHEDITAMIAAESIEAIIQSRKESILYTAKNLVLHYVNDGIVRKNVISRTYTTKKGKQLISINCEIWNSGQTNIIARAHSGLVKTEVVKQVTDLLKVLISR